MTGLVGIWCAPHSARNPVTCLCPSNAPYTPCRHAFDDCRPPLALGPATYAVLGLPRIRFGNKVRIKSTAGYQDLGTTKATGWGDLHGSVIEVRGWLLLVCSEAKLRDRLAPVEDETRAINRKLALRG